MVEAAWTPQDLDSCNPTHERRLRHKQIETSSADEDVGAVVNKKLAMSRAYMLVAQKPLGVGVLPQQCGQLIEGGDSPPLFHSLETPLGVLPSGLGPLMWQACGAAVVSPEVATEMLQGLEHLC